MTSHRIITCGCGCGRTGRHEAHGYVSACYQRWNLAGRPDTGPPPPKPNFERDRSNGWATRRERMEEFAMVRRTRTREDGVTPISIAEAARAVGVTPRTGQRYATALKEAS